MNTGSLLVGLVVGLLVGGFGVAALWLWRNRVDAAANAARDGAWQFREQENQRRAEESERRDQERERRAQEDRAAQLREQGRVLEALAPVRQSLSEMTQKVSELERQRQHQYGTLEEQLRAQRQAHSELRGTTESLASALRSNSTRGVWGETQLRRVVEAAGMLRRVDFDEQKSVTGEATGRPDMTIHLPGNKFIYLDAKAPFDHFLQATQLPVTNEVAAQNERTRQLDLHVRALRSHIDGLAGRGYWKASDATPEFVIAFIPTESLLSSALEQDPDLLNYAFTRKVALATPVNLWAMLKTVAITWQHQEVSDEAKVLLDLGNTLYQRLGTMAEHVRKLGKSIDGAVAHFNAFVGSLESSVLPAARRFPGVDSSKLDSTGLVGIDRETKLLTAREYLAAREADE